MRARKTGAVILNFGAFISRGGTGDGLSAGVTVLAGGSGSLLRRWFCESQYDGLSSHTTLTATFQGGRAQRDVMDAEAFTFLIRQVEATKRAHEDARRCFWEITAEPREWPTEGLPRPDGSERFRKVLAREKFAMKARVEAMVRLNRFLMDGTIPNDVQEILRKLKAAEDT